MNKRHREIIGALLPAVDRAIPRDVLINVYGLNSPLAGKKPREVEGLSLHASGAGAELMVYGPIGGGLFDMGITATDVALLLREAGPVPIAMRINSPGGDVFQGTAIHTLLARHPGAVTASIDGLAASAASVIMLAASRIEAPKNAFVMIHDAMTGTYGNAETHRTSAQLLDKVSGTMAELYAARAGGDAETWRTAMTVNGEDGTWYTGAEAYDVGLIDALTGDSDEVGARLSGWVPILPEAIAAQVKLPPEPAEEPEDETPEVTVAWDSATFLDIMKEALA